MIFISVFGIPVWCLSKSVFCSFLWLFLHAGFFKSCVSCKVLDMDSENKLNFILLQHPGQLLPVQCSKVSKYLHQATSFRRSLQTRLSCNTGGWCTLYKVSRLRYAGRRKEEGDVAGRWKSQCCRSGVMKGWEWRNFQWWSELEVDRNSTLGSIYLNLNLVPLLVLGVCI